MSARRTHILGQQQFGTGFPGQMDLFGQPSTNGGTEATPPPTPAAFRVDDRDHLAAVWLVGGPDRDETWPARLGGAYAERRREWYFRRHVTREMIYAAAGLIDPQSALAIPAARRSAPPPRAPTERPPAPEQTAATAAVPAVAAPAGLARYTIESEIGRGGMGVVVKAWDTHLRRHVALKTQQRGANEERFRREAQVVAGLGHPLIVPVLDTFNDDDTLYIVYKFINGKSMDHHLREPFGVDRALRICLQVAQSLAEAHAARVIHRDVKPANIILERAGADERAWLTDFGICKLIEDASGGTATGDGIGTPAYMPQEQRYGDRVDQRADVYALGCVLRECVLGRRFHAEAQVPWPSDVDPHLAAVIKRATAYQVFDRTESAQAFADELAELL